MVPRSFLARAIRVAAPPMLITASALLAVIPPHVCAMPVGPQVVAGDIAIVHSPGAMTLTQATRHAIVNWQSFNLGAGEHLRLAQPGADAAMLARVIGGGGASELLGSLQADGRLFLINPQGVVIGRDARIDTAAFLASTLDVADADFLVGGAMTFKGDSDAGVINLGTITAREGNVMLFAHRVENAGTISAPRGTAGLGAGTEVHLAAAGDTTFVIKLNLPAAGGQGAAGTGVDNSGVIAAAQAELKAAGGSVYDLAVNHRGLIKATGVEHRPDGRIVLTAAGGTVGVSGTAVARDVDGGGGEILVGGDFQGRNPAVPNATNTVVTATGLLDASAAPAEIENRESKIENPSAGRVIVWADGNTRFLGAIDAGGSGGGFAEVSGKEFLDFRPRAPVDLGADGTLLLDPTALRVSAIFADNNLQSPGGDPFEFSGFASSSILSTDTLATQLASTNVVLNTSTVFGDIAFEGPLTWNSGRTLRVASAGDITFGPELGGVAVDITAPNGTLELYAGRQGTRTDQFGTEDINGDIVQDASSTIAVGTLTVGFNADADIPDGPGRDTTYSLPARSGDTSFNGVLDVDALQIDLSGRTGALTATNAANTIGALRTTGTGGDVGNIDVANSDGPLNVTLNLSSISATRIRVVTPGDLNLAAGTAISFANPTGDVILASTDGAFTNSAGSGAMGANARHLIYAKTTVGKGGLTGTDIGNHPYVPDEVFADTISRFFYAGASPVRPVLTYTADNKTKTYGDANPELTYTVSGFDGGVANDVTGEPELSTTATLASGVAMYDIDIGQGSLQSSNYDFTFADGSLEVTGAPVLLQVQDASRAYGSANPAFSADYVSGLKNNDLLSELGTFNFATTATAASGVGTYEITGSASGTSPNYTLTFDPGTLTITRAPLTVTADDVFRVYGAANPALSATGTGLVNGDSLATAVPDLELSTTADTASNVGSYPITATGTSTNYEPTFVEGKLSVTPASLLVKANDATREYGDPNPEFTATITGLVNGDESSVVSGIEFSAPALTAGVGEYAVTPFGGSATNYELDYEPGVLSITRAPLRGRIADITNPYGNANPAYALGTLTGLKNGDTADVIQNLAFSTTTPFSSTALPGRRFTVIGSGTAANYSLTWEAGSMTIVKAPATIAANSATKIYGHGLAPLTATFSGFLPGDEDAAYATWRLDNPDSATLGVGSYPVGFTVVEPGLRDTLAALYDITVQPGTLTVTKAPLVLLGLKLSSVYGDTPPAPGYTINGLLNGDPPSVLTGVNIGTAFFSTALPGVYTYGFQSTGTAQNYEVKSISPGTLTVARRPLVLASPTLNMQTGTVLPLESLVSVEGMVLGGPSFSAGLRFGRIRNGEFEEVPYNASTPPGTYVLQPRIIPAPGTTLADVQAAYDIQTADGTLILTSSFNDNFQTSQVVTLPTDPSLVYGNVSVELNSDGLENLEERNEQIQQDIDEQIARGSVTVRLNASGGSPLTVAQFTQAARDFGDGLFTRMEAFLEEYENVDVSTLTEEEQEAVDMLRRVDSGEISREAFYSQLETNANLRALAGSWVFSELREALETGETLTPAQEDMVARVANRINEHRRILEEELVNQKIEWQIEAAESSINNQYALKTMPDIARSAEQMAMERLIAGAAGVGAGVVVGAAAGAAVATGTTAIFPFVKGGMVGAVGASAGAFTAAVAVAVVAIGVVSVVMLVQEGENVAAYDNMLARAQSRVSTDLSGFNLATTLDADGKDINEQNRMEFFNAFSVAMLDVTQPLMGGAQ